MQTSSWTYAMLIRDTQVTHLIEEEETFEEETAADERRHNISHMSQFISICDLITQVKAKLPNDIAILSEATVLYLSASPKMFSKTSQYYTWKINLRHAIQRRQLRSFRADSHYCHALFWYM